MQTIKEFLVNHKLTNIGNNFIDLGLPSHTLWASYNLGATDSIEFGDYYAWGEITPNKDSYEINNYKPTSKDMHEVCKEGRIPSLKDFEELYDNTIIDIVKIQGIICAKFTSKINNNEICVPFAGIKNMKQYDEQQDKPNNSLYFWLKEESQKTFMGIPRHYTVNTFVDVNIKDKNDYISMPVSCLGCPIRLIK